MFICVCVYSTEKNIFLYGYLTILLKSFAFKQRQFYSCGNIFCFCFFFFWNFILLIKFFGACIILLWLNDTMIKSVDVMFHFVVAKCCILVYYIQSGAVQLYYLKKKKLKFTRIKSFTVRNVKKKKKRIKRNDNLYSKAFVSRFLLNKENFSLYIITVLNSL